MEQGEGSIRISMHLDPNFDVMAAVLVLGDLQHQPAEADTVVVAYYTLILFTEDILQGRAGPGDKHAGWLLGGQ